MNLPNVNVVPAPVVLSGGMDRISTAMLAQPGSASFALNYEPVFGGGYQSLGGIERYDGRPSPSAATYFASVPQSTYDIAVGDTVTGGSSAASGVCVYAGEFIALTKVTGAFVVGEEMRVGGVSKGIHSDTDPAITAGIDNEIKAAAADRYRADITAVPGDGPVRGFAVLKGERYAWRDDATAMKLYRATSSGWTQVDLGEYVTFTNASADIPDGATLTRGGVTATITRMVLETGSIGAANSGKLILTARSGGNFSAGAATATGAITLTLDGAQTAITLSKGGRVQTDLYNFTASTDTQRLYGCDGVNPEFEFDGSVYVPLNTGMATRATAVRCHKNHAFFGYRGSLQFSGIANPYTFEVVAGAEELGTGDVITGLVPVPGSESSAAMLVLCSNSAWMLFGNDSSDFQFTPLSRDAGGNAYSAEDCGAIMVHDTPGMRAFTPTDVFGNFAWNLASRSIEPLVQNRTPVASCFAKAYSRYRLFFADGTAISGTPGKKDWEWTTIDYGRQINVAWSGEVAGVTRTYYGDEDGFVYEADVGRSLDGEDITAMLKLHGLNQKQPMVEKTYRWGVVETIGESPFTLTCGAEFNDSDTEQERTELFSAALSGRGALYDVSMYEQAFFNQRRLESRRVGMSGNGYDIVPFFYSRSANQLPHQIKTLTVFFTPRRVRRR